MIIQCHVQSRTLSKNQSINQKRIRVTKVTNEIKKFSIGAGTTAVLVPKRQCLVVSSRSVRRQPEKLGRRWWKV